VISVRLARSLRDAGLRWSPAAGDRFVVADRDMDDQVFVLSDMTIEVRTFPTGPVIAFNGTTEWALDSLDQDDALWLPAEHQLRDLLGESFRRLERVPGGYTAVVTDGSGDEVGTTAAQPADAYALALLARLTGGTA
jgi:hypothetical protein